MASIVLGLVFMGNSRIEERNDPSEAVSLSYPPTLHVDILPKQAKFLQVLRHKRHGLETLAIIYSLPHVFLMWG